MALDETKTLYYKALQNNKRLVDRSNSLLNPTVSNDITSQAYINTDFNYSSEINQIANTKDLTNSSDNTDSLSFGEHILSFFDNIAAGFVSGFVKVNESLADVGAYAIGGMTGNQDIIDWANHDYSADVKSAMMYDKFEYNQNDFENFTSDISSSIGFMLPSIIIGIATSGGSAVAQAVGTGASLAIQGAASTGQSMEESMNEEDDLGKAWLNGIIDGGIEVGSEIVVGWGMGKIAKGVASKVTDKALAKSLIELGNTWAKPNIGGIENTGKKLVAEMFEEGMEEVAGDLVRPLFKTATKGAESLEDYGDADYWAGVGKSFLSGAVTSGLLSGQAIAINKASSVVLSKNYKATINSSYENIATETNNIDQQINYVNNNYTTLSQEQMNQVVANINASEQAIEQSIVNIQNKVEALKATEYSENVAKTISEGLGIEVTKENFNEALAQFKNNQLQMNQIYNQTVGNTQNTNVETTNVQNTNTEITQTTQQNGVENTNTNSDLNTSEQTKLSDSNVLEYINKNDSDNILSKEIDSSFKTLFKSKGLQTSFTQNQFDKAQQIFKDVNDSRKKLSTKANAISSLYLDSTIDNIDELVKDKNGIVTKEQTDALDNMTVRDYLKATMSGADYNQYIKELNGIIEKLIDATPKSKVANNEIKALKEKLGLVKSLANELKPMVKATAQFQKAFNRLNTETRLNIKRGTLNNLQETKFKEMMNLSKFFTMDNGLLAFKNSGQYTYENFVKQVNIIDENYVQSKDDVGRIVTDDKDVYIPYNPILKDNIAQLKESLNSTENSGLNGKDKTKINALQTSQIKALNRYLNKVNYLLNETVGTNKENFKVLAQNSLDAVIQSQKQKLNILQKGFKTFDYTVASSYSVIRSIFGESSMSDLLVTQLQDADSKKTMFIGKYSDVLNNVLSKDNVGKTLGKNVDVKLLDKTFKIQNDELVSLYLNLTTEENFEAIKQSGVAFYGDNNKSTSIIEKYHGNETEEQMTEKANKAEQLKTEVIELMNKNPALKTYADTIKGIYNNGLRADYITWYRAIYGENPNIVNDYYSLKRVMDTVKSAERAMMAAPAFSNALSRTDNKHQVAIGRATNEIQAYVRMLAQQTYVMPIYRKAYSLLNTTVNVEGKGQYKLNEVFTSNDLELNVDKKDLKYLKDTLDAWGGKNFYEGDNGVVSFLMKGYTISKLSMNVSTILKQTISAFTSNVNYKDLAKGAYKFTTSSKFRNAYNHIVDNIGQLKYRDSGSIVVEANTNPSVANRVLDQYFKMISMPMKGISFSDKATIGVGITGVMSFVESEGYEVGSKEFYEQVEQNVSEMILSQIGTNPNSQNAISRGSQVERLVFGYMQGAVRALYTSMRNKAQTWVRYRNNTTTLTEIRERYTQDFQTVKTLQNEYNEAMQKYQDLYSQTNKGLTKEEFQELKTNRQNAEAEVEKAKAKLDEAQSKLEKTRIEKNGLTRYKAMGGKMIPAQIAANLIANGALMSLINSLIGKFLKGKDDEDAQTVAMSFVNNAFFQWIPIVNVIANSITNDYDISIGSIDSLNGIKDALVDFTGLFDGSTNVNTFIRKVLMTAGDIAGIPFSTLYSYVYGITKDFNPEMAIKMNNTFYGVSLTTQSKALNTYASEGNVNMTKAEVKVIMEQYKTGSVNDKVATELSSLLISGYNCIPNSKLSSYTDENGNTVNLTTEQQNTFTKTYSKANKIVSDLISTTAYESATEENQAKAIDKVYDAYYNFAKAKAIGATSADSRLGNLLYYTDGNVDLTKYVNYMQTISTVTATKSKTRKELVTQYINKLSLTKNEKLLLLVLCGFSVGTSNQNTMISYLMSKGMTRNQAKSFLGISTSSN